MSQRVPPGWNPIFWKKYGRAIPESVQELPRCDLRKLGPPMLEIIPRGIGTDQEGWAIGKEEIPCQTLEDAIVIGLEILARG